MTAPTVRPRGGTPTIPRRGRRPATGHGAGAPGNATAPARAEDRAPADPDDQRPHVLHEIAALALAFAREGEQLRERLTAGRRENALLRHAAAADDLLDEVLLDGGGVDDVARAVSQITGKPVALYDAALRPLAAAGASDGGARLLPLATMGAADGAAAHAPDDAAFLPHALLAIADRHCEVVEPAAADGAGERHLVAPVTVGSERGGYVVVREYPEPFGPLDRHVARRAAMGVALVLAGERRTAAAECDAHGALVADLLRGDKDAARIERRARYLGIDLAEPHAVCLVAGRRPADPAPSAGALRRALAATAQDLRVLTVEVAEGTVAVLELRAGAAAPVGEARSRVEAALARLGGGEGAIATLSGRCAGAAAYPAAHREAAQALACVRTFASRASGPRAVAADELGAARVLLATSSRADVDRFVADTLGPLLEPQPGCQDLLATLSAFFDHGRSVRCCAHALDVHENTVRYRLGRVEDVTGLAVTTDAEHQLMVQLALLVLRLERRSAAAGVAPAASG